MSATASRPPEGPSSRHPSESPGRPADERPHEQSRAYSRILGGYRRALRVLPAPFRDKHAGELVSTFEESLLEARARRGRFGVARAVAAGYWDLLRHRQRWRDPKDRGRVSRLDRFHRILGGASRSLRRAPGFAALAVLTQAQGIGANAALFSVVDAVLLEDLPFPEPDRLAIVWHQRGTQQRAFVFPAAYLEWRKRALAFERLAALREEDLNLSGDGQPARVPGARVTGDFFSILAMPAMLGRTLATADARPGSPPVVVLGHEIWQSRFAADPAVVGSTIRLDGEPHEVVGVMPADFRFSIRAPEELWVALRLDESDRADHTLNSLVIGRLAPGATLESAASDMDRVLANLRHENADIYSGFDVRVAELAEDLVAGVRPQLFTIMAAVGLVLLVACVNAANLLLARNLRRRDELALRQALGAGRGNLVAELLAESALLALLAAAGGALFALWTVRGLVGIAPVRMPHLDQVGVDGRVLAFTLAIGVATTLLFGLLPSWRASRVPATAGLTASGRSTNGGGEHRSRELLIGLQAALVLIVLVGAGLLTKSFWQLLSVDAGVDLEQRVAFELELSASRYPASADVDGFFEALVPEVEALPGVRRAAVGVLAPLKGAMWIQFFAEEHPPTENLSDAPAAWFESVSPGYFETLGIPLLRGRTIDITDRPGSRDVAVVNQALARELWPDQEALGKWLDLPGSTPEIVGVVGDVHQRGLQSSTGPMIYVPWHQMPFEMHLRHLVVHAAAATTVPAVRRLILRHDPEQPIASVRTLDELRMESVAAPRFQMTLLSSFGALALLLAMTGIYGTVSFLVGRRTSEIGVRMALGARPRELTRWLTGLGMRPVVIGSAVGTTAALALSDVVDAMLFEVSSTDPWVFAAVAATLLVTAALAAWLPARRAATLDVVEALRSP